MSTTPNTGELRRADISTLVGVLRDESARRYDVVVPAKGITMGDDGTVAIAQRGDAVIDETGVSPGAVEILNLDPTLVASEQLGERLGIPRAYYRRCEDDKPALLAQNVNAWLSTDERSFYCRTLLADNGRPGVLRSVMSDRYRTIDSLDVTMAVLAGVKEAGVVDLSQLQISADKSIRRLYLRIAAPGITADASDLVHNYTDPITGRQGRDFGLVAAGISVRNSDVGEGAFVVAPELTFLVCRNGMTRTTDAIRSVHIGGRQDEGVIDWSEETQRRNLSVITSKTTDAVRTFLSPGYIEGVLAELRGINRAEIADPVAAIEEVTKKLKFSTEEQDLILGAFIHGRDFTPFGVAQAMTNVAQHDSVSADRAADLADQAWSGMLAAAELSS